MPLPFLPGAYHAFSRVRVSLTWLVQHYPEVVWREEVGVAGDHSHSLDQHQSQHLASPAVMIRDCLVDRNKDSKTGLNLRLRWAFVSIEDAKIL